MGIPYFDFVELYKKVKRLCRRVKDLEESGATDTNIANTDLTFTGTRTHDGNDQQLNLVGFQLVQLQSTDGALKTASVQVEYGPGGVAIYGSNASGNSHIYVRGDTIRLGSDAGKYELFQNPPLDAGESDYVIGRDDATGLLYRVTLPTGGGVETITYADAATLVSTDAVVPGTLYNITDAADDLTGNGVYVYGASTSSFSLDGWRVMLIPNPAGYEDGASVTYDSLPYTSRGLYNVHASNDLLYASDDFVIYNGHYWRLTSVVPIGTSPVAITDIQTELNNIEFTRIEKDDPLAVDLYLPKVFGIKYDFANDWIYQQFDEYNNVVGIDKQTHKVFGSLFLPANPVDYTDWGLADYYDSLGTIYSRVENNKCPLGFYNNSPYQMSASGDNLSIQDNDVTCIVHNYNAGSLTIRNNKNHGVLYGTNDIGGIVNNTGAASDVNIENNIFVRGIVGNVQMEKCWRNKVDYIFNNSNVIDIKENIGHTIQSNTSVSTINNNHFSAIENNLNVGNILENFVHFITLNDLSSTVGDIRQNVGDYITENESGPIVGNNVRVSIGNNTNPGIIENNICLNITNNANSGNIMNNTANTIDGNSNNGSITNNIVCGNISSNSNDGAIDYNVVRYDISSNANLGNISSNNVNGVENNTSGITYIQENTCSGSISANSDGGGGPWGIYSNTNNGYISAAQTADVTDPIVNK